MVKSKDYIESCQKKLISHLVKLNRIKDNKEATREELLEGESLLKQICEMGDGKKFCKYMDKVADEEIELGRNLTIHERMKIYIYLFG